MPKRPEEKPEEEKAKPKKEKKGKKIRTGGKHSKISLYKLYKLEGGNLKRERKFCPRCGPGNFLAKNPGRVYCGGCGYTEFERRIKSNV